MEKVSIVIVNYNGGDDTLECIKSLRKVTEPAYNITVVDNASTDDSLTKLGACVSEDLEVVCSKTNRGFAGGNNLGIKHAMQRGTDYVLLLNNDTVVEPDFLDKMLQCLKQVGEDAVIAPKIKYYSGKNKIWYAGGSFNRINGRCSHTGIDQLDDAGNENIREVSFISGCCMLIPVAIIKKTGFLNEEYFLYCEDLEYCCRLLQEKVKMLYCPEAVIYHKIGASTGKNSGSKTYYTSRNKRCIIKNYIPMAFKPIARLYNWLEEEKRIFTGEYDKKDVADGRTAYKNSTMGIRGL